MVLYLKTRAGPEAAGNGTAIEVPAIVRGVIEDIRSNGDSAVRQYSTKFDRWEPTSFKLSKDDIQAAIAKVSEQTVKDIKQAQANVRAFALAQRDSISDFEVELQPGYIPGGCYPLLASAHMTILTAKAAGVDHVIACTPPINAEIPNSTVAAMHLAGADEIFILGGVQAIAAMAVGTDSIRKVDFIAGPGNAFVAEAKRQLFGEIGIDPFAGPTEVLIVADEKADPFTIATDLLSQAEHGPDSPAVLITTSDDAGRQVMRYIDKLLETLSTAAIASSSWRSFGEVVVVENIGEAYALADEYAFEHVQILTERPREELDKMRNYGALFLGEKTCVSSLEQTMSFQPERQHDTLWVSKFLRTVTYQEVKSETASGELGRLCGRAARAENFEGHARSGDLRACQYLKDHHD
ncbi:histidinol dehydrogenase [Emergomyces africanus]|uniref:Histidinol dehydrogenase n=1 Tax=Emergomyces africanus TaxID=1955775 RepID=A0A1B7P1B5_9EURO|nr:histidinol dehydrogenase [Emergomyces africanus]